jgi:hypothetical protein
MTDFNVTDYGASTSNSPAQNRTALQAAIAACDTAGGGEVVVPWPINYGYESTSPSTHPDFTGTVNDMKVTDLGMGATNSAPAKDGIQERIFYHTVQTTPIGQHDGNQTINYADWHPAFHANNNAIYAAKGHPSRTESDNYRASFLLGIEGKVIWQITQGIRTGDLDYTDMLDFSIGCYNPDQTGRANGVIFLYKSAAANYGVGSLQVRAAHWFYHPQLTTTHDSTLPTVLIENPNSTEVKIVLRNSAGAGSDFELTSSNGVLVTSGPVRLANYTTAGRPAPGSAGSMIYDLTLQKPIWFNGVVWKDAAGNTV